MDGDGKGYQKAVPPLTVGYLQELYQQGVGNLLRLASHASRGVQTDNHRTFGTGGLGFDTPGRLHDFRFIAEGLELAGEVFVDEQIFQFAVGGMGKLNGKQGIEVVAGTDTQDVTFGGVLHFVDVSLGNADLLTSFVVCHTPHLAGHFHYLGARALDAHDFPYTLKVDSIPQAAHHAPGLEEFVLIHPVLADVLGDVFQIGTEPALEGIFAESNLFLLFFVHLQLEGVFPVVHHFLPNFIVRISSFCAEVAAVEAGVEAVLPVFVGNLLEQGLPAIFPFCHGPFQHELHLIPFRLAFPEVVPLLLQIQVDKLNHGVVKDTCTDLIAQHLHLDHGVVHHGEQIGIQGLGIRLSTLSGGYKTVQCLHIEGGVISGGGGVHLLLGYWRIIRLHISVCACPHAPRLFPCGRWRRIELRSFCLLRRRKGCRTNLLPGGLCWWRRYPVPSRNHGR